MDIQNCQPAQVDNSGYPPPKKAIIVYCYLGRKEYRKCRNLNWRLQRAETKQILLVVVENINVRLTDSLENIRSLL